MNPNRVRASGRNFREAINCVKALGEGTYGKVYEGHRLIPLEPEWRDESDGAGRGRVGERVAVKIVKPFKDGDTSYVTTLSTLREIKLLRELNHPNVVRLQEVVLKPSPHASSLALVFDLADYDLHRLIRKQQRSLPVYMRKTILYHLLLGVHYLHENWVMHRDLKPHNILVSEGGPHPGRVQVGDLGLARVFQSPLRAMSDVDKVVVTLWYRAPELLLGARQYTPAVDMWAVGCIAGELVAGRELFSAKEIRERGNPFQRYQCERVFGRLGLPSAATWPRVDKLPYFSHIDQWRSNPAFHSPEPFHRALKLDPRGQEWDLIRQLLALNPERRLTAREALEHPYFTAEAPLPGQNCFDESSEKYGKMAPDVVDPDPAADVCWDAGSETPRAAAAGGGSARVTGQEAEGRQAGGAETENPQKRARRARPVRGRT